MKQTKKILGMILAVVLVFTPVSYTHLARKRSCVHVAFIWKAYNINCKNDAFSLANTVVKLDFTVYYI